MRGFGAILLVLGAGFFAAGVGASATGYSSGGPLLLGLGAMLITAGWLLRERRRTAPSSTGSADRV